MTTTESSVGLVWRQSDVTSKVWRTDRVSHEDDSSASSISLQSSAPSARAVLPPFP